MVRISRNRLNMEDGRIDRSAFKDYGEIAIGSSSTVFTGSSYAINIENGNSYNLILNDDCAITFANPTGSGVLCSFTIILKQDQVGGWTVTWPEAVRWQGSGGAAPTLPTAPGDFDVLTFFTYDGGQRWYSFVADRPNSTAGAELWTWGLNTGGELGLNSTADVSSPAQVGSGTDWAIISGDTRSAAIKIDGSLWTWGDGSGGVLGNNSTADRSSPAQVGSATNWATVDMGYVHMLAVKTDGTLWSWGNGGSGRLGSNSAASRSSPAQVGSATNWSTVLAGYLHSFAIKTDGSLWAWGDGSNGRLGLNSLTDFSSPTQVGSDTSWIQVSGYDHTLALKTDGTLWSWGSGGSGRLGSNSTASRSSPAQIGSGTDWRVISAWDTQSVAIKTDGTLWTWGDGSYGRLGNNSTADRSSPAQVGSATNWLTVHQTAWGHTRATKTDGTLWVWGRNQYGQLGLNSTSNASSPTQVGSATNMQAAGTGFLALRFPSGS